MYVLTKHIGVFNKPSKHYITSNLYKVCYGLTSDVRKEIFFNNNEFMEDLIGFNKRHGFVKFKFFCENNKAILLLKHDYGYSNITNFIEEICKTIENDYLEDLGFKIHNDSVQIFYLDIFDHYSSVILDKNLDNPQWKDLNDDEIRQFNLWFEQSENPNDLSCEYSISSEDTLDIETPIFFETNKQYDSYKTIRKMFNRAKKELFIIDPYIDYQLFEMFEIVNPGVKIKVLTSKTQGDSNLIAKKFKEQRGNFELKKTKGFHDRYVFIDCNCFLFGASLNNFASKASTIVPINDEVVSISIKKFVDKTWSNAKQVNE